MRQERKKDNAFWLVLWIVMLPLIGKSQSPTPMSVRELLPIYGIQAQFLDDTSHFVHFLNTLNGDNSAMTDSCITLNAKLMAVENALLYDYRHVNDTVWIDASHYLDDYTEYCQKIRMLSEMALQRAHDYIEREHIRQDAIQQTALNQCKDTIERYHRTIINACEGIGISDKTRKKELKDIYYAYLSVYNRYDFSMKRSDSIYLTSLDQFSRFQRSIIDNLLSNNNYSTRISNFSNTLRVRCTYNHNDVLRSYQRVFRPTIPQPTFSTLEEYNSYIHSMQTIVSVQECYLTAVDLRDKIAATNKRISSLYSPTFREAAKTYQEVVDAINVTPAFNTLNDGELFIARLNEFIQVQECYLQDFERLKTIQEHGNTIILNCSMKYTDLAKSYKQISKTNSMTPRYTTLDDAARFSDEIDYFECIQRQYDTILTLRQTISATQDSIGKGWLAHLTVYNGYHSIRKQFVLIPTFIDLAGGHLFINHLNDYINMQDSCLKAIDLYKRYRYLNNSLQSELQPFRNIRKAYSLLEKDYFNINTINHLTELHLYIQQLEALISIQEHLLELTKSGTAQLQITNKKLKNIKDTNLIELIIGL